MLLYNSAVSGNCYKVRLLFAHLGVEYERRPLSVVDKSNREDVLGALNPGLRVPTVVLEDGRPLGESGAILWYFADGTEYVPTDPFDRAKARRGRALFYDNSKGNCVDCHGQDATGIDTIGSRNSGAFVDPRRAMRR